VRRSFLRLGRTTVSVAPTELRESAARRRVQSAIREEVRRVAEDATDREEMRIVREQIAALAPTSFD
jgi:hypothetical protein